MVRPAKIRAWWQSRPGFKPCILLLGGVIIAFTALSSIPAGLTALVSEQAPKGYVLAPGCSTITETVNQRLSPIASAAGTSPSAAREKVARRAMVMVGILTVAVLFWGTEAISMGGTDLLVVVLMYVFCILPPNDIARAYLKDEVFFILGVLGVAVGVSKTGFDRRLGLMLLARVRSMGGICLFFFPMVTLCAGFVSGHALVALLIPMLMGVYKASCRAHGVDQDRPLAMFLLLGLAYAGNIGGVVSPGAGGWNALMMGYLSDQGAPISFAGWLTRGVPFAMALSFVLGLYLYLVLKPRCRVVLVDPGRAIQQEMAGLPKFGGREAVMALILVSMILAMVFPGQHYGLGGPALGAVFAMIILRIVTWEDLQNEVALDVVGLYGAACAMGAGLQFTGGALWAARSLIAMVPGSMIQGDGLFMVIAVMAGVLTNFMGDGVVVAALGPVVLPMAALGQMDPWMAGFGCAFASSFAHCLVFGSPNNAICFGMGRDPETGDRLLRVVDFLKYGVPFWFICMGFLHAWALMGQGAFMP
jgi:sodium-dependent dicarboxylate transporter 2/3/5